MALKIGALARKTGTNSPTIRYYEDIGLLPKADRFDSGQRSYGKEDIERLTFVRRCREFGFSIDQVRALLTLMQDRGRSCTEARDLAQQHLETVRAKLRELRALELSIAAFVHSCDSTCAGGPGLSASSSKAWPMLRALGDRRAATMLAREQATSRHMNFLVPLP
jgi:DNA-binding transcriptional MerR regulator